MEYMYSEKPEEWIFEALELPTLQELHESDFKISKRDEDKISTRNSRIETIDEKISALKKQRAELVKEREEILSSAQENSHSRAEYDAFLKIIGSSNLDVFSRTDVDAVAIQKFMIGKIWKNTINEIPNSSKTKPAMISLLNKLRFLNFACGELAKKRNQ